MAIEIIDLGTVAQDGADGDVAREAFEKVNANFAEHEAEIDALAPRVTTVENEVGQLEIQAGQIQGDLTNLTESFNILSSEVGGNTADIQNLENSREYTLVPGEGITIDRTDPTAPVISSTGSSGSVWGQITGDLSNQEDLKSSLDTLQNSIEDNSQEILQNSEVIGDILTPNQADKGAGMIPYGSGVEYIQGSVGYAIGNQSTEIFNQLALPNGASLIGYGSQDLQTYLDSVATNSISVSKYGAIGDGITDDTIAIQTAIDANPGCEIKFDSGKTYLLNSYINRGKSSIITITNSVHLNMIGAKLVVGNFFDDKSFILFNSQGIDGQPAPVFSGLSFIGGEISFSGATNRMRSAYILYRLGIHTGQVSNVLIQGVTFKDGDLANAIKANDDSFPKGQFIRIVDCVFENLVQENVVNSDHSAIYLKANNSGIYNCHFRGSTAQNRKIGCAVEIHGTLCDWIGGSVQNYQKGVFLAALVQEGSSEHISISNIVADITNSFAYLWSEAGVYLRDVLIQGCNIRCRHIEGQTSDYNKYQGLLTCEAFSLNDNTADGITCKNNRVEIMSTVIGGRDTAVYMYINHSNISIESNDFFNCGTGIQVALFQAGSINDWKITNNKFYGLSTVQDVYIDFNNLTTVNRLYFKDNSIQTNSWAGSLQRFVRLNNVASNCFVSVKPEDFIGVKPTAGAQLPIAGNKVVNCFFNAVINYPSISGSSWRSLSPSHADLANQYASVSNYDYELRNVVLPSGVDIVRCGTGTGGAPGIICYNHQVASSTAQNGNCDLITRKI